MPKTIQTNNCVYHRRADLENPGERTALSLEWGETEVGTKSGESLALAFVPCRQHINLGLNATNMMDYLATQPMTLPARANKRQLKLSYLIHNSLLF